MLEQNKATTFKNIFDEFHSQSIQYCVWKSLRDIETALSGVGDLDLIVAPQDKSRLIITLLNFGFVRADVVSHRKYRGVEDYLCFEAAADSILKVQLYDYLVLGGLFMKEYSLHMTESIISSRVWNEKSKLYTIDPSTDRYMNRIRLAMKIRYRDIPFRLVNKDVVCKRYDADIGVSNAEFCNSKIIPDISKLELGSADIYKKSTSIFKWMAFKHKISRKLKMYSYLSPLEKNVIQTYRESRRILGTVLILLGRSRYLEHRAFARSGKVIVFVGQDGAGKSTTIQNISKFYGKSFDTKNVYLGSGDGSTSALRWPILFIYKLMLRKGLIKTKAFDAHLKKDTSNENKAVNIVKLVWIILLCRERRKKLEIIYKALAQGKLVFVDRLPQSKYPDAADSPKLYSNAEGELGTFARCVAKYERETFDLFSTFKPSLLIKMVVDSEVAAKRKPLEVNSVFSELSKKRIMRMNFGCETTVIDNTHDFRSSESKIRQAIWAVGNV